jgi:hypothetical protein
MTKLTLTLSAALLVLGALALPASAQNEQRGAASIHALKNATPIVTPAACRGGTGYCGCGPGWVSGLRAAVLPLRALLVIAEFGFLRSFPRKRDPGPLQGAGFPPSRERAEEDSWHGA